MEGNRNLSLRGFISILFIFRSEYVYARVVLEEIFDKMENILLTNSLMGTTIQDGSKRERSVCC